jgi:hypothetical protein
MRKRFVLEPKEEADEKLSQSETESSEENLLLSGAPLHRIRIASEEPEIILNASSMNRKEAESKDWSLIFRHRGEGKKLRYTMRQREKARKEKGKIINFLFFLGETFFLSRFSRTGRRAKSFSFPEKDSNNSSGARVEHLSITSKFPRPFDPRDKS